MNEEQAQIIFELKQQLEEEDSLKVTRAMAEAKDVAFKLYETQIMHLKQTVAEVNLNDLTEFKVCIVDLRRDVAELKSDVHHH